jgi:micrococcal nuclease
MSSGIFQKNRQKFVSLQLILISIATVSILFNFVLIHSVYQKSQVVSVPDGDSLDLRDGRRVRLIGIDAPEKGRCLADRAKTRLTELTLGKHIRMKNMVKDTYGRTLANVIIEDPLDVLKYEWWWLRARVLGMTVTDKPSTYINRVMVEEGLAKYSNTGTEYDPTLSKAHLTATSNRLGIYSSTCRQTEPPSDKPIKGNIREGKKYYYLPDCRYYSQVIVDTSYGDQWFASESDAKTVGYQSAPACN